jgi:hypothetical protein
MSSATAAHLFSGSPTTARGNATLAAAPPDVVDAERRIDNHQLRLRPDTTTGRFADALRGLRSQPPPRPRSSRTRRQVRRDPPGTARDRHLAHRMASTGAAGMTTEARARRTG